MFPVFRRQCYALVEIQTRVHNCRRRTCHTDSHLLSFLQLRVTAARPGTVNFELDIKKEHTVCPPPIPFLISPPSLVFHCLHVFIQNRLQILHGGTIASMVDLGGSLAVASRGLFATGVSTDLNVTYLNSGGKVGDTIRAEVTCDKFGKTLAYTR